MAIRSAYDRLLYPKCPYLVSAQAMLQRTHGVHCLCDLLNVLQKVYSTPPTIFVNFEEAVYNALLEIMPSTALLQVGISNHWPAADT
jgi:hypothetical protein